MRHAAAEGRHVDARVGREGVEIGLIPELVVQPLRHEERIDHRPEQHIAARTHIELGFAGKDRHGQPGQRIAHDIGRREDAERRRARGVRGEAAAGGERALAALGVEDAAVDVAAGAEHQVAAAEFHQLGRIGRKIGEGQIGVLHAARHPRIRRDDCVRVHQIRPGGQRDVAAAERAEALEEIAEVDPPCRRGRGIDHREERLHSADREEPRGGIDVAAPVEPVVRHLPRSVRDDQAVAQREAANVALRRDRHIAAGHRPLRAIPLLHGAQPALTRMRSRRLLDARRHKVIRGEDRIRIRQPDARRVDRRELVAQLHGLPRRDVDVAGAGADDLEAGAAIRRDVRGNADGARGESAVPDGGGGTRGRGVRHGGIKLPDVQRARIRDHRMEVSRLQIRASGEAIGPRLRIGRERGLHLHQLREPHRGVTVRPGRGDGREPVAERVVENEVARGPQRQHSRRLLRPVAEAGEIPIRRAARLDICGAGGGWICDAEGEVAGAVDDFDTGRDDQQARVERAATEQLGFHRRIARGDECRVVRIHQIAQRDVQRAEAGAIVNAIALDEHGRRTEHVAQDRVDVHVVPIARSAQMQRAGELAVEGARSRRGEIAGHKFIHAEIDRRAGLHVEHRGEIRHTAGRRAGFEPDFAALPRAAEELPMRRQHRPGFEDEATTRDEHDLPASHAARVDGPRHADFPEVRGDDEIARHIRLPRGIRDHDVARAHAQVSLLEEPAGIQRRAQVGEGRERFYIEQEAARGPARAGAAEQDRVGAAEGALRGLDRHGARVAAAEWRRDGDSAPREQLHVAGLGGDGHAAAVRIADEVVEFLHRAGDIEIPADRHIAGRRTERELAAREQDAGIRHDARAGESEAGPESAARPGGRAPRIHDERAARRDRMRGALRAGDDGRGDG